MQVDKPLRKKDRKPSEVVYVQRGNTDKIMKRFAPFLKDLSVADRDMIASFMIFPSQSKELYKKVLAKLEELENGK